VKSLPGVCVVIGIVGTEGIVCAVMAAAIVIVSACINGIIVPSGPITGIAKNKSPAKTNKPTSTGQ